MRQSDARDKNDGEEDDGYELKEPGCLLRLLEDTGYTKCPRCILYTHANPPRRLFHSAPPIVLRLFEGGVCSRKYGIREVTASHKKSFNPSLSSVPALEDGGGVLCVESFPGEELERER